MEPTSDERREVARAMRGWADRYPQGDFTWGVLGSVHYRIDGVDTRPSSNQEVLYMLADLIDPTCEVARDNPLTSDFAFRCKSCGEHFSTCGEPRYCPSCGARVVSGNAD